MTANQITRVCYSAAIGSLCGLNYGIWPGAFIAFALILGSNFIGEAFGDDQ